MPFYGVISLDQFQKVRRADNSTKLTQEAPFDAQNYPQVFRMHSYAVLSLSLN